MRRYRRLKLLFLWLPLLYCAVGLGGHFLVEPHREVFPVFSWMIFRSIPNETSLYYARVRSIDGNALAEGALFPVDSPWPVSNRDCASSLLQRLGRAVEQGRGDRMGLYRELLEQRHFPTEARVEYQLVRRTYRPLETWDRPDLPAETVVARWESHQ